MSATPISYKSPGTPARPTNWAFVLRVGFVSAILLALVGYGVMSVVGVWRGGIVEKDGYFSVDLQLMSSFGMDQRHGTIADVPPKYRELSGKKVLLQGEIAPGTIGVSDTAVRFDLCYSVAKCCVGTEPQVQHFVNCKSVGGRKLKIPDVPRISVYGTLRVNVVREDGLVRSVFQMEVERIDPA